MPLYMDIHIVDSDTFSVEDVVKAHMEDLDIQEQFEVTQLKYWVNVEAKTLFCLMEGPNKEACNEVHKQSHGNTACNIIEVTDDEFHLFLGKGTQVNDLAKTISGEIDTGFRTILSINIIELAINRLSYVDRVHEIIEKHEGELVLLPEKELMISFIYASKAVTCALEIYEFLKSIQETIEFNLALSSGRPVDEIGNKLFEDTKKRVKCLCASVLKNTMSLDHETMLLSNKEKKGTQIDYNAFAIIRSDSFNFLFNLFDILDYHSPDPNFKSENLYKLLGLSKSQVYRKLKALTGMPPNRFIQELRLRNSLKKIRKGNQTISEIAYDAGFSSPTYFTEVFRKRFGISPSTYVKIQKRKLDKL